VNDDDAEFYAMRAELQTPQPAPLPSRPKPAVEIRPDVARFRAVTKPQRQKAAKAPKPALVTKVIVCQPIPPDHVWTATTRGEAILEARTLAGVSQKGLAKLAGETQEKISKFELGKLVPGLIPLERIGTALGIHPGILAFPTWKGPKP
jgi:ribosome-binding protein aMBF1 (putative translation factor)